jgi:hypothetical protein
MEDEIREHVARMGEMRSTYKTLIGKPEGWRQLGRPRRLWEDNINMDVKKTGWRLWTGFMWLRTGTGGGFL